MKCELTINVDEGATTEHVAKAVADSLERMARIDDAAPKPADPRPVIEALVRELRWCSGSADFAFGGRARDGWECGPAVALASAEAWLKEHA